MSARTQILKEMTGAHLPPGLVAQRAGVDAGRTAELLGRDAAPTDWRAGEELQRLGRAVASLKEEFDLDELQDRFANGSPQERADAGARLALLLLANGMLGGRS